MAVKVEKAIPIAKLEINMDVPMNYLQEFLREWENYVSSLVELAGPVTKATLTLPSATTEIELDYF